MSFTTITDDELVGLGVTGLDDTPELSTEDMQAEFDEYPKFLKDKFKVHITELESNDAASNIGANVPLGLETTAERIQPILNELASRSLDQEADLSSHKTNFNNPHNVSKVQLGLGNVDNTSDLNKPVSTAQQAEINGVYDNLNAHKAPNNHASAATTYGTGDATKYGHVKLTDTYNPEGTPSAAASGVGASQKAVSDAYDDLFARITQAGYGDMFRSVYDPDKDGKIDFNETEGTLPVNRGGTGQTTVAGARNALGLGNTSGALPIANGGTGQTTAAGIRNALGLGNTTDALPVANGGTGLTSQPSMLTNLGSTSADTIMKASPRPGVTGTLPVSNGGTGLTSQPSMLTNLGSTSADTIMKASPRPGVTGTLPLANGGTGATDAETARANLHVPTTDKVSDNAPYLIRKGKGNLADIILEGYSLPVNQLVQNGNFADTSNWSKEPNVTLSVSNNEATITNTTAGNGIYQVLNAISGHKYLYVVNVKKAVAGTVRFNILGNASNKSVDTSYTQFSGVVTPSAESTRIGIYSVEANSTVNAKNVWITDLTQEFGTDIADHIYSKEQASAGSGIAWIKSYGFFNKDYFAYDAGSIQSVRPSGRKVVGKNLYVGQPSFDGYTNRAGYNLASETYNGYEVIYKNAPWAGIYQNIDVIRGVTYTFSAMVKLSQASRVYIFSKAGNLGYFDLGTTWQKISVTFTASTEIEGIRVELGANNVTIYLSQYQLEIGSTATDFEPYTSTTVALPNEDLRGILKRDGDNLYADGDTDIGIGNKNVRFKLLDLGAQNWIYQSSSGNMYVDNVVSDRATGNATKVIAVCGRYLEHIGDIGGVSGLVSDKTFAFQDTIMGRIIIRDTAYTDAATFKTAMNGVYLVYPLATPTTESTTPWQNPQRAYLDGTEEFIDEREVPLPVGHTSVYQLNETLPPIEDYVDSNVAMLQANFQDGVDTIYNAIVAEGVTPSASTPQACATGIATVADNEYASGKADAESVTMTSELYVTGTADAGEDSLVATTFNTQNVISIKCKYCSTTTGLNGIRVQTLAEAGSSTPIRDVTLAVNQELTFTSEEKYVYIRAYGYHHAATATIDVTMQAKILR